MSDDAPYHLSYNAENGIHYGAPLSHPEAALRVTEEILHLYGHVFEFVGTEYTQIQSVTQVVYEDKILSRRDNRDVVYRPMFRQKIPVEPGIVPPQHPNCRSNTTPASPDEIADALIDSEIDALGMRNMPKPHDKANTGRPARLGKQAKLDNEWREFFDSDIKPEDFK